MGFLMGFDIEIGIFREIVRVDSAFEFLMPYNE